MKAPNGDSEPLPPRAAPSAPALQPLTASAPLSQWFESLYRSQLLVLFIHDAGGAIVAANPAFCDLLGCGPEETAGLSLDRLLGRDLLESYRRFLEDCRTLASSPRLFEMALKKRDEGEAWLEIECLEAPGNGTSGLVLVAGRDVTSRKRAEQQLKALRSSEEERKKLTVQLQQAQKMEAIGTLAGGIAHDFNNLLMAIQGNVSLALFEMEPSHPQHRIFANIERLVRSGADLTSKLLGYARRGKYESRPLVLNDLVRETSETFGRMRKDITIQRELSEDVKSIIADKGQIEQVLLNLFVNAADAMPTGGRLVLKTRNVTHQDIPFKGYTIKAGNYVLLTVSDTGVGMDKDVIPRIFDPFFTTKKMGRGTGLGLASAYGIVKGHNGYIDVTSEKGKGSVFYVYLPATEQKSAVALEPSRRPEGGIGTILLVDDEDTVLDVTARMIERLGYTVLQARSGGEAIASFKQNSDRVSLVILDMIMPNMSGGEVFDELKRINPRVKVLLASGYSMQGQAREIMNRGCIGFIQKPFTMEDLSLKLRSALTTR